MDRLQRCAGRSGEKGEKKRKERMWSGDFQVLDLPSSREASVGNILYAQKVELNGTDHGVRLSSLKHSPPLTKICSKSRAAAIFHAIRKSASWGQLSPPSLPWPHPSADDAPHAQLSPVRSRNSIQGPKPSKVIQNLLEQSNHIKSI